jgi:hypothetical protein
MIPFIYVIFDPDWNAPVISDTVVIHQFEFSMRPLNMVFDLNFFLRLIQAMVTRRILIATQEMKELVVSVFGGNHRLDLTSALTNEIPSGKEENFFSMVFLRSLQIHPMSCQVLLSLQLDKVFFLVLILLCFPTELSLTLSVIYMSRWRWMSTETSLRFLDIQLCLNTSQTYPGQ